MKKNQLALIFLTLVVMLAVWYIKSPLADKFSPQEGDNVTPTTLVSSRLEAIQNMRDSVMEERSSSVVSLDAIIASADSSITEKENAYMQKKTLSDWTEKEVTLETLIISMGYTDSFVHATDDSVEVIVVSDNADALAALEIIGNVKDSFADIDNVVVTFKTLAEIESK